MSVSRPGLLGSAFAAGLAGSAVAIAIAGALGAFDRPRPTAVVSAAAAEPTAQVAVARTPADIISRGFDAARLYRERAAGVVTVSSTFASEAVSGSGFVVSADGYVVTNAHVITNSPEAKAAADVHAARAIYVRFSDGNSVPAKVVGFDLFDDIGVLRVDPRRQPLEVLRFGDAGSLSVGDPLAVIGSPFGKEQAESLSVGVVSALGRTIQPPVVSFSTSGVIQTDAAVNHGNSGGPVFDAAGRVVGVAAQIESTSGGGEGVGFAIPAAVVRRSLRDLVGTGKVVYAWLGISSRPVTRELARQFALPVAHGLQLDQVSAGGPAELAGLRAGARTATFQDGDQVHPDGDILETFDGKALQASDDLSAAIAADRPGQRVPIDLIRGGKRLHVVVTLGERPPNVTS